MRRILGLLVGALAVSPFAPAGATPVFNLTYLSGTSAQAQTAFQDAANFWSSALSDSVVIDLTVGTGALGSGILGSTGAVTTSYYYSGVKSALTSNATSALDATAVANLPSGSSFSVYINRTSDNPNGSGSATPYVDSAGLNNEVITMTNANAKALGLTPTTGTVTGCIGDCDGFIKFSTGFTYDFDRGNGITAGTYDFFGLAVHEIGHALGFISGVDILDINSPGTGGPFLANQFIFVSPLDLYRCSTGSVNAGADLDWTADTRAKSFSVDGCATSLAPFSTGKVHGDGRQASHWKDNLGLGILDPTADVGELLLVTALDLKGMDAIGWELQEVPEPATLGLFAMAVAGLVGLRRRASAGPMR